MSKLKIALLILMAFFVFGIVGSAATGQGIPPAPVGLLVLAVLAYIVLEAWAGYSEAQQ